MTYDFENKWNSREIIILYHTFLSSFVVQWWGGEAVNSAGLYAAGASCDGRPIDTRSTTPRALDNATLAKYFEKREKITLFLRFSRVRPFVETYRYAGRTVF